ncbi:transposase [Acidiphilium sp. PM]|uniref:transposase n=1 Tax=Acidiphilium sp. PM TaxID=1043206 RepID=UPI0006826D5E
MDVINDDAKARFRRIEVLTGPGRRRRWSDAEKARIVAETLRGGATVTEVARRWALCPQQVWGWRRQAREGHLALIQDEHVPAFRPVVPQLRRAPDFTRLFNCLGKTAV